MRVTQLTQFNSLKRYLDKNREALAKYQQQLSSDKRVTKASDDSVAFTTSRHLNNAIRKNKQYQSNIAEGLTKARAAENSLNGMLDVLTDFKNIAIQGASDSVNEQDRENMANQVNGLKKKLIELGNAKINGVHLFAGTNTADAPFSIDATATGGVSDTSNNKALKAHISDTSNVPVTVTGKNLRNTGSGDLFKIMQNVENALRTNDRSAVHDSLDDVDKAFNHVTSLTSKLGSKINRMDFLNEQLKGREIEQNSEVSRLVDTDFSKALLQVQKYQTSYQAALSVHSRIIQTSLLNYL